MKIIISPDSFKGTLRAIEAARAIEKGIKIVDSSVETVLLPVADGGEGTMEALILATNGTTYPANVQDPLGREIIASYGVLGNHSTCVIEMALASGLTLLQPHELNPHIASTFGTGQLISVALDAGFREFIICIGGSATNDGGTGMLYALGLKFLDADKNEIEPTIEGIAKLDTLDFSNLDARLAKSKFTIASDVRNPLIGESGATYIYGAQKGVQLEEIAYFDQTLTHWANIIQKQLHISVHHLPGAGAAGGLGAALFGFLDAEFQRGIHLVLTQLNYREKIQGADLIITGEGQSDEQTLYGKTPIGVLQLAREQKIPCMLLSGFITQVTKVLLKEKFDYVLSIVDAEISQEMAMREAEKYITLCIQKNFKIMGLLD